MFESPGSNAGTNDANLVPGSKGKKRTKVKTENPPKNVGGRKDNDGIEATIAIGVLKKRTKELESLYLKAEDAKAAFNLGIKGAAQASGLMASVVAKVIKARVNKKYADKKREAEQLELVFGELGE